jgi:hypothetical protein
MSALKSFTELKQARSKSSNSKSTKNGQNEQDHVGTAALSASFKYPGVEANASIEVRKDAKRGRGLFATKKIARGTVLLKLQPHLAILDKRCLDHLCSSCMMEKPDPAPLRRCSGCKAVYYCNEVRLPNSLADDLCTILTVSAVTGMSESRLDTKKAQVGLRKAARLGQIMQSCRSTRARACSRYSS